MKTKLFICCLLVFISSNAFSQEVYQRTLKLMGSRFDFSVVANSKAEGESYIDLAVEEIVRIETVIEYWLKSEESISK